MATSTSNSTQNALNIGVMYEGVQLSDITCIDILANLDTNYVKTLASIFPKVDRFIPLAIPMVFHYISSSLSPTDVTADIKIVPTCTYDTAPTNLDILLIGGNLPTEQSANADRFMKEAAKKAKCIITTSIGSLWLASAGVLEGKKATTNRGELETAKKLYPGTEWVDQRWVVDGKIWTSGGAGAGIDMVATYALEIFDKNLVTNLSLNPLDFDPKARGQFYKEAMM